MLDDKLRIGDAVRIKVAQENLDWGYGRDITGKTGTVLGFGTIDYGYTRNFGKEPGIYENKSWVNVDIEGKTHHVSTCFVEGVDIPEDRTMECGKRLSDLPETKFWPGDKVKYVGDIDWMVRESVVIVDSIEYNYIGEFCNDGVTPMPHNCLRLNSGGTCNFNDEFLVLVERGNVWKYYNDEPISFNGIDEEAAFYMEIGRTTEVRNPETNLYSWDQNGDHPVQALKAIKNRLGHGMNVSTPFFCSSPQISVYRFLDEEVGERVRKATLEGFEERVEDQ